MKPSRRGNDFAVGRRRSGRARVLGAAGTVAQAQAQEPGKGPRLRASHGPAKIETRIGPLEFTHDFANGYPTDATIDRLYDERDFQRACQAYLWSLPAVSFRSWQKWHHGATRGHVMGRCRDPVV
jgi:hypothetical protein